MPDESVREYESGANAAADTFDMNLIISSITSDAGTVVIELAEAHVPGNINWTGEEQSFF